MRGQLQKIQSLLKSGIEDNIEVGIQLLKAYCYSLNYSPTLLHLLESEPRYETATRIKRIQDRILDETSKRMFSILNTTGLFRDKLLCLNNKVRSRYAKSTIPIIEVRTIAGAKIRSRRWVKNPYYSKGRFHVHRFVSAETPEEREELRMLAVRFTAENILQRKIERLSKLVSKGEAARPE